MLFIRHKWKGARRARAVLVLMKISQNFTEFQYSRVDNLIFDILEKNDKMIFWTKIREKMIFWGFPKSVSVLYNNEQTILHPVKDIATQLCSADQLSRRR